ncbi:mevalonate kinase [Bacteroidota bacterium]
MKDYSNIYYAKILLFGEYSVIFDSMGLTIPYTHFRGELSYHNEDKYTDYDFAVASNKLLKEYLPYLKIARVSSELKCEFDIERFEDDISNGLYFESTIPLGFGLGSSGALVAALYDNYALDKINNVRNLKNGDILKLREVFAQLESFFHGKSSGLDPLNSYIKFPLLINSKKDIQIVGLPRNRVDGNDAVFLVNTEKPGRTQPLVNYFLKKCEDKDFFNLVKNVMIPLNNTVIKNLVDVEIDSFFNNLALLSNFQLENLSHMIPGEFHNIWQNGIDTGDYYLKLCGSGGGGYLLGFTKNYEETKMYLTDKGYNYNTVFRNPKLNLS